jgi:hypothetical protein
VSEGLSTFELASEAAERNRHRAARHDYLSIAEAVLLSIVTIVAAWSGYAAAKWTTESRLHLARAANHHTAANRAFQKSVTLRTWDASAFNTWFAAYVAGNEVAQRVAIRRFRPEYRVAFNAWLATHPFTNPDALPGPQNMPQYRPSGEAQSRALDAAGEAEYAKAEHAGGIGDDYIRTTVILASVLFLVGIGGHFPRGVRIGLTALGSALLIGAAVTILQLPIPA